MNAPRSNCSLCSEVPTTGSEATGIFAAKSVAASALLYLLYIVITCPCKPALYSCHLTSVYTAIAVLVAVVAYYNGTRVATWNGVYPRK